MNYLKKLHNLSFSFLKLAEYLDEPNIIEPKIDTNSLHFTMWQSFLSKFFGRKFSKEDILSWMENGLSHEAEILVKKTEPAADRRTDSKKSGYGVLVSRDDIFYVFKDKQSTFGKNENVGQEILIPSFDKIPSLYIYLIEKPKQSLNIPSNMAVKYGWLYRGLSRIFESTTSLIQRISGPRFENFILANISEINKLTELATQAPKFLGAGANGIAFDIGDNKVLKLMQFSDSSDHETQNVLWNKKEFGAGEVMIHGSSTVQLTFPKFKDKYDEYSESTVTLNYKISQKIDTPHLDKSTNEDEQFEIDNAKASLNHIIDPIFSYSLDLSKLRNYHGSQLKSLLETMATMFLDRRPDYYFEDVDDVQKFFPNLKQDWLVKLVADGFYKKMTYRGDLHSGNIGIDRGYFKFFDF